MLKENKKIVSITSHFLKFQAQAAIKTLISSPTCRKMGGFGLFGVGF
jgi:hypothetical protein